MLAVTLALLLAAPAAAPCLDPGRLDLVAEVEAILKAEAAGAPAAGVETSKPEAGKAREALLATLLRFEAGEATGCGPGTPGQLRERLRALQAARPRGEAWKPFAEAADRAGLWMDAGLPVRWTPPRPAAGPAGSAWAWRGPGGCIRAAQIGWPAQALWLRRLESVARAPAARDFVKRQLAYLEADLAAVVTSGTLRACQPVPPKEVDRLASEAKRLDWEGELDLSARLAAVVAGLRSGAVKVVVAPPPPKAP